MRLNRLRRRADVALPWADRGSARFLRLRPPSPPRAFSGSRTAYLTIIAQTSITARAAAARSCAAPSSSGAGRCARRGDLSQGQAAQGRDGDAVRDSSTCAIVSKTSVRARRRQRTGALQHGHAAEAIGVGACDGSARRDVVPVGNELDVRLQRRSARRRHSRRSLRSDHDGRPARGRPRADSRPGSACAASSARSTRRAASSARAR